MTTEKIKELISQMTLEEKASMCSGEDYWHTQAIERLGIPNVMVSDGPHGLRKQDLTADHLGVNESIKAVCFPAGCATAASFNRDLIKHMGEVLGNECQAEGVSVLLGPAINIKRSPVCGRNFEYYSEDPYVATEMAAALIEGIQSKNVGTSIKHFVANNQEKRRLVSSSNVDERTMREIYLAAFEGAIKKQKPWTVMCSYNMVNGVHMTENRKYLHDVLRDEWGYEGVVVSDWGAVNDRVPELASGMDLEMPSSGGENDKLIAEAVRTGKLDEAILDETVERMLTMAFRYVEGKDENAIWDLEKDHMEAAKIAEETIVLLKNEGVLPLSSDKKIAFIGKYATQPRYQGGGSSHINSFKVTSAMDAVSDYCEVSFAMGFDDMTDVVDESLLHEAVEVAKASDVAVLFVGLPDSYESEGFDRPHMRMPENQNLLIQKVAEVQPNTVVVLHNGSPVEMPWVDDVKGILEAYLSGQAEGMAIVDILFGKANPSGKLPETFPIQFEDNPSYLFYGGEKNEVDYREGVFVGYRYYDKKKMNVLFPFGYGLSYTTFSYSNLKVDKTEMKDTDTLTVSVDITNTGECEGKEAVQLYVEAPKGVAIRPVKELRGFEKVSLQPGETKTVTFTLEKRAFAYYNVKVSDWYVESGEYIIHVAKSSRDIQLSASVQVASTQKIPIVYTLDTALEDIREDERTAKLLEPIWEIGKRLLVPNESDTDNAKEFMNDGMIDAMTRETPLRAMMSFSDGEVTMDMLQELLKKLNELN